MALEVRRTRQGACSACERTMNRCTSRLFSTSFEPRRKGVFLFARDNLRRIVRPAGVDLLTAGSYAVSVATPGRAGPVLSREPTDDDVLERVLLDREDRVAGFGREGDVVQGDRGRGEVIVRGLHDHVQRTGSRRVAARDGVRDDVVTEMLVEVGADDELERPPCRDLRFDGALRLLGLRDEAVVEAEVERRGAARVERK